MHFSYSPRPRSFPKGLRGPSSLLVAALLVNSSLTTLQLGFQLLRRAPSVGLAGVAVCGIVLAQRSP
eukprot:6201245-Pleurochrysis_carterae.AAC.2